MEINTIPDNSLIWITDLSKTIPANELINSKLISENQIVSGPSGNSTIDGEIVDIYVLKNKFSKEYLMELKNLIKIINNEKKIKNNKQIQEKPKYLSYSYEHSTPTPEPKLVVVESTTVNRNTTEPIVTEPEPIIMQPEPEPIIMQADPEPIIMQSEPIIMQSEPAETIIIQSEPEPIVTEPEQEPIVTEPAEVIIMKPELIVTEPEPIVTEPEPIIMQPEPETIIMQAEPEPIVTEPEPIVTEPTVQDSKQNEVLNNVVNPRILLNETSQNDNNSFDLEKEKRRIELIKRREEIKHLRELRRKNINKPSSEEIKNKSNILVPPTPPILPIIKQTPVEETPVIENSTEKPMITETLIPEPVVSASLSNPITNQQNELETQNYLSNEPEPNTNIPKPLPIAPPIIPLVNESVKDNPSINIPNLIPNINNIEKINNVNPNQLCDEEKQNNNNSPNEKVIKKFDEMLDKFKKELNILNVENVENNSVDENSESSESEEVVKKEVTKPRKSRPKREKTKKTNFITKPKKKKAYLQ